MPNQEEFKKRGYVIERNFLSVHQTAVRLGIVERTVLQYIAAGKIYAELLDPDRQHSDKVVSLKSVEDFEKWRDNKRHSSHYSVRSKLLMTRTHQQPLVGS